MKGIEHSRVQEILRTRNHDNKTIFNFISKKVTEKIRTVKDEKFQIFIEELTATADTNFLLWKITQNIKITAISNPPTSIQK